MGNHSLTGNYYQRAGLLGTEDITKLSNYSASNWGHNRPEDAMHAFGLLQPASRNKIERLFGSDVVAGAEGAGPIDPEAFFTIPLEVSRTEQVICIQNSGETVCLVSPHPGKPGGAAEDHLTGSPRRVHQQVDHDLFTELLNSYERATHELFAGHIEKRSRPQPITVWFWVSRNRAAPGRTR